MHHRYSLTVPRGELFRGHGPRLRRVALSVFCTGGGTRDTDRRALGRVRDVQRHCEPLAHRSRFLPEPELADADATCGAPIVPPRDVSRLDRGRHGWTETPPGGTRSPLANS